MSRYISNGEMGRVWMAKNCEQCLRDDPDNEVYCPVLTALMCDEYPIEGLIRHADTTWPDELECTYFQQSGEVA